MISFLLFLLCKCFFWEQLSQLYPQLELWMKSRSNTSSFLFLQQRGRMHRKAFIQIVMFRELSFYYFLDSEHCFHFHFSAWLRRWLVWRWAVVEQGLTPWKKSCCCAHATEEKAFKHNIIIGKQMDEHQKMFTLVSWILGLANGLIMLCQWISALFNIIFFHLKKKIH